MQKRGLHIAVLIALSFACFAQEKSIIQDKGGQVQQLPEGELTTWLTLDPFLDTNFNSLKFDYTNNHSSVKPISTRATHFIQSESLLESKLTKQSLHSNLFVWPATNFVFANVTAANQNTFSSRTGIGGAFTYYSSNYKWHIRGTVLANNYGTDSLRDLRYEVLPNSYFSDEEGREIQPQFRASYKANKFFNFQAGIDHNFIGEGDRSMFLGDYSSPYPFVQLRSKLWKFEFTNIYQFLNEENENGYLPKFTAAHYLNFTITDRLSFGVFETVIYSPKDDYLTRGIELEYLNPFIFYRPLEYGLGSQDKVVVGSNINYAFNNIMIYSQFVIDDFVLNEIVNRTRWWANKYGGQIGLKGRGKIRKVILTYRSELNFARPFTFSHLDERTVYGHQGVPLGHPLGANFAESFSAVQLAFKNSLKLGLELMIVQQGGMDGNDELSYGSDIYNPYTNRPTLPNSTLYQDYGYQIGGNGKLNRVRLMADIRLDIFKKWKLEAFFKGGVEQLSGSQDDLMLIAFGGIRSRLWNERSIGF